MGGLGVWWGGWEGAASLYSGYFIKEMVLKGGGEVCALSVPSFWTFRIRH